MSTVVKTAPSKLVVPFLGLLAAIQGCGPNLSSTALVDASRALHMSGSTQALASSMQTMAIAASVITTGLLADRIGRRRLLVIALVVGIVGQLTVAIAPTAGVYMLGQAVAGVGLGATYCAAFGLLNAVVPRDHLARAMGAFTSILMLATVIFTFIGGSLSGVNWRLTFLLIPVVSAACLVVVPIVVPKVAKIVGGSLDPIGQILLVLGIVSFLYACSQLAESLTAPKTLVPLFLGIALLVAFVVWEKRNPTAFFPVELFTKPVFVAAMAAGFIYNFGNAVGFLQLTNLWQYVTGIPSSTVALWQLPLMASGIAAGFVTGRAMSKGLSDRVVILIGGTVTLVGMASFALVHRSHALLAFIPGSVLVGAGVVIAAVPYGSLILRDAPSKYLGPVTSSRTTVGQFFYTLGFSLSTVLVGRLTRHGVTRHLEAIGVPANRLSTGLDAVNAFALSGAKPTTTLGDAALRAAGVSYGHAFSFTLILTGLLCFAAGVGGFVLLSGGRDV
jgi:MFS family permease